MIEAPWLEKMSMESENLQSKLRVISTLVLFFPFSAFLYVMQSNGLLSAPGDKAHLLLVFLTFLIVLAALYILHDIFKRFVDIAIALKKASTGETTSLEISRGTLELREVSQSFNQLLQNYEAANRDLKRHTFSLLALRELVELASKSLEMEELLEALLDKAMGVAGAGIGSVFLYEHSAHRLRAVVSKGLPTGPGKGAYIPMDGSPMRFAVTDKQPVLVTDIEHDERFGSPNKPDYSSPSFVCLPVIVNHRVMAVINLTGKDAGEPFNQDDVNLLSLMIEEIRFALENARLHANVKKTNNRLKKQTDDLNREISLRKKAEGELRNHQQHLEELVNTRTRELVAARDKAEAANRAKSAFLANMSHELRTPLTAITGFSELMADGLAGPVSKQQKKHLHDVIESSHDLLALINNLLDLSKLEAGEMELELGTFDVRELLESTLSLSMEGVKKQGLEISMEVEDGIGEITADMQKIKQVVRSLIANAIKFTPDGSIAIHAEKVPPETGQSAEAGIVIKVTDTGIGIAADDQERLFCHFLQLDDKLSRAYGGAGLGLILCKKIVELHGGHIWVESAPGEGSIFGFTLPAKASAS